VAVESGGITPGIPDSNSCAAGMEFWIEFKETSSFSVDLRPLQVAWISRRTRHGGVVWIAVRRRHDGGPRRGVAVDQLYIVSGLQAAALSLGGLNNLPGISHKWEGGPGNWSWPEISAVLTDPQERNILSQNLLSRPPEES
jgi:hypothetical protein